MSIFRRRTLFWLIKAYVKKWGKVIGSSFLLGLLVFFLLLAFSQYVYSKMPKGQKVVVGVIGAYTPENLPQKITRKLSRGMTAVQPDGSIQPDAAESWSITDMGKTYIFTLKEDLTFTDREALNSTNVSYDFADVTVETPDERTLVYKLNAAYSPFLVTVSRPIFKDGLNGIGDYQIIDMNVNGSFVESLELRSVHDHLKTETYKFYPDEAALKQAFMLGEINTATGLTDISYKETSFEEFPNVTVTKNVDHSTLVTLFYNTRDAVLSDKKLRTGLTYALPDTFPSGARNYVSYPPTSAYFNADSNNRHQDITHAKLLLESAAEAASTSGLPEVTMKVLSKYMPTAKVITKAWEEAGVRVKLEEVQSIPANFQMYLGDFNMPRDPDQYSLWHSSQPSNTNITRYSNLRIDKLLEDGRITTDQDERMDIYADFQKYLLDDSPASFLYFPYLYTVERK